MGMRAKINIVKPVLASAGFFALTYWISYVLKPQTLLLLFLSSPFNITSEAHPAYNLYVPAMLILIIGLYLKNLNKSFIKKCSLRGIIIIGLIANYIEVYISFLHYHAISLGTSVITLCFIVTFLIALEAYVENKQRFEHLYGHFLASVIIALFVLLIFFIFLVFFTNESTLVHAIGITTFLVIFTPFYERANIRRFILRMRAHSRQAASPQFA